MQSNLQLINIIIRSLLYQFIESNFSVGIIITSTFIRRNKKENSYRCPVHYNGQMPARSYEINNNVCSFICRILSPIQ